VLYSVGEGERYNANFNLFLFFYIRLHGFAMLGWRGTPTCFITTDPPVIQS
jgi:hypothetical protein